MLKTTEKFPVAKRNNSAGRLHAMLYALTDPSKQGGASQKPFRQTVTAFFAAESNGRTADSEMDRSVVASIEYQRLLSENMLLFEAELGKIENDSLRTLVQTSTEKALRNAVNVTNFDAGRPVSIQLLAGLDAAANEISVEGEIPAEEEQTIRKQSSELREAIGEEANELPEEMRQMLEDIASTGESILLYFKQHGAKAARERFVLMLGNLMVAYGSLSPEKKERAKKSGSIKKAADLIVYTSTVLRSAEALKGYIPDFSSVTNLFLGD